MTPLAISLRPAAVCLAVSQSVCQSLSLPPSRSLSLPLSVSMYLPGSYDEAEIAVFLLSFLLFLHAFLLHLQTQTQRNERSGNEIKMQEKMAGRK